MSQKKNRLELEMVDAKCELCGFKGKVVRFSRPVEGYTGDIVGDTFVHRKRNIQQICYSCLENSIVKLFVDLRAYNDHQAKEVSKLLENIELMIGKHDIKCARTSLPQRGGRN